MIKLTQYHLYDIFCIQLYRIIKMPTTYNEFQTKQEEFWAAVRERFEEYEYKEFHTFFIPLFFLPDNVEVSDVAHPVNLYGADRSTDQNIDALRIKITSDCNSCPAQLLRYMFEEEDHAIYEALVAMIRTYKLLGNSMRAAADTDTDSD